MAGLSDTWTPLELERTRAAVVTLWRRELVRFWRDGRRVVSAVLTPVLFWIFMGMGMNHAMHIPQTVANPGTQAAKDIAYVEYLFPGMIMFMVLSTAVFSTISVIEDRREGFLQGVLAAPISRLAIVLGKVLGGATLATGQGMVLLLLWPWVAHDVAQVGHGMLWLRMALATPVLMLAAAGLTALGLCLAWPLKSTSSFHAVMMLVLMPMWFLSGAVFPAQGAPGWLALIMALNPLSYAQSAFAVTLTGHDVFAGTSVTLPTALGLTALFTLIALGAATRLVSKPRRDGLA